MRRSAHTKRTEIIREKKENRTKINSVLVAKKNPTQWQTVPAATTTVEW